MICKYTLVPGEPLVFEGEVEPLAIGTQGGDIVLWAVRPGGGDGTTTVVTTAMTGQDRPKGKHIGTAQVNGIVVHAFALTAAESERYRDHRRGCATHGTRAVRGCLDCTVTGLQAEVAQLHAERAAVIDVLNLYAEPIVHRALDSAGLLSPRADEPAETGNQNTTPEEGTR